MGDVKTDRLIALLAAVALTFAAQAARAHAAEPALAAPAPAPLASPAPAPLASLESPAAPLHAEPDAPAVATSQSAEHTAAATATEASRDRSSDGAGDSDGEPLRRAHDLIATGDRAPARLTLERAAERFPAIADRVALDLGELSLEGRDAAGALAAFRVAESSPSDGVRVHASEGVVRSLLASGAADDALDALEALRARYPAHPHLASLSWRLARLYEQTGRLDAAVASYRALTIDAPSRAPGRAAARALERLAARAIPVPPLTVEERIDRARSLLRDGPMHAAGEAIDALEHGDIAEPAARAEVLRLSSRLARYEGRWSDALAKLRLAKQIAPLPEGSSVAARVADREDDLAWAAEDRSSDAAERRLDALLGEGTLSDLSDETLLDYVEIASAADLVGRVDDALDELSSRTGVSAKVRFAAAMFSAGVGDDATRIALLEPLSHGNARRALAARYQIARAHERLGQAAAARETFDDLARAIPSGRMSRTTPAYYAVWASARLGPDESRRTPAATAARQDDLDEVQGKTGYRDPSPLAPVDRGDAAPPDAQPTPDATGDAEPTASDDPARPAPPPAPTDIRDRLDDVAARYGEAFPALGRAAALLRLGNRHAAGTELYTVYLEWRAARGRAVARAGLASLAEGRDRDDASLTAAVRAARRGLSADDRATLADAAEAVGDLGTAVGFDGLDRYDTLPRAYAPLVERAAEAEGLDPDLLFAVMRTESVYQPRIVSFAGAVGLMQIMPVTAQRIASELGRTTFTADELLNPETSIELAAWYLRSLIDRWGGNLALAIASYNGGPHNVRLWLATRSPEMPLDAFLETIPFHETRRYVRRVLARYAAYRGQRGLAPPVLDEHLPDVVGATDPVGF